MFKEIISKYYDEMVLIREDIHRHPELSYKEERTSRLVEQKLLEYGVDGVERIWCTGLCAVIKGGKGEGKCIALRADMDALPVSEDTGVAFSSEVSGVMHACGHDMHTAILLGVAKLLCDNRALFCGSVKLIFQPAEEAASPADPSGGASHMCHHGAMDGVDAIVALHINPSKDEPGKFALRKGVVSSGFDLYRFDVTGKEAHGSQPHTGNDAILAISQLIVLLQQVVSRNVDPLKTAILTVGTISGGTAVNIIPGKATCGGVFRYYDNGTAAVIKENSLAIAKGVETLSGCKIDVQALSGYACVENDPELIDVIDRAICEELGEECRFYMDEPASGSEDFSYYLLSSGKPGALLWLNAAPIDGGELYPLHSAKCCVGSEAMLNGASGLASIAVRFLNS